MTTTRAIGRCFVSAVAFAALGAAAGVAPPAHAQPFKASDPVPSPGRAIASDDDATSIATNPANLPFLPAPELRWMWVRTDAASTLPARGHQVSLGLPFWMLATGLRFDALLPPAGAAAPLDAPHQWLRWTLAGRAGDGVGFGTTFAWSWSGSPMLDEYFSVATGLTLRPVPFVSVAAVARDWNRPTSRGGDVIPRSYDLGIAVRPTGHRAFEVGFETAFHERGDLWTPRATAGLDVPRLGRLRGDITFVDPSGDPDFVATAGLDLNLGLMQLSGGGVFGSALTRSGTGYYAGAALRAFREPGVRLPARVARIRIESTPGVRKHTRLLARLWRLARDPEVEGVALVLRAEPAQSLAHAEELGDAVRLLRANGKKVMCHLEDAGGKALYVCSQADRIAMNPAGGLRFAGVSSRYLYFGDLLKKLGVRADFVRIGAHKGAAEQFTHSGGTQPLRDDHQDLIDQFEQTYLHDVGGGRRLPLREVERRIESGPYVAREARDAGLVDVLAYEDEIDRAVEEMMGRPVRIADDDPPPRSPNRWGDAPRVALVYLSGDMIDGESQFIPVVNIRLAGSYTIARALKRAREDQSVRAVVFRVETGGGSSLAADVILREAILTARVKPLIVSMGSSAASGGYYASVAGKVIYANPSTVTGSIGIFYGKVDVVGLLDKLGVKVEQFRSGPRADAESFFRPFTDDERRELGVKVKQFYDLFIGRVAEGRSMRAEEIDAVARGRVWTGRQARARRLVDKLGGLRQALAEARALGGLPYDAPIEELPDDEPGLLGLLIGLLGLSSAEQEAMLRALTLPPGLVELARALSPFLVHEPGKPLARTEVFENVAFGPASGPKDDP